MKNYFFALTALFLTSTVALAHPGGHSLTCKSAQASGSKQVVSFELKRSNGTGWYPPSFSATIDKKKFDFTTEDEMKSFGETFHNSPLGVITVTANNLDDDKSATQGYFQIVAIPNSVKAFDSNGKPVKWNFKAEKDECNDSNGKATFKGIFRGYIRGNESPSQIDTQILDCELSYNSGMAC